MSSDPVTRCAVCGTPSSPALGVISVCTDHAHIDAANVAIAEQHAALIRWLDAREAWSPERDERGRLVGRTAEDHAAREDELIAATDALEQIARRLRNV